MVVVGAAEGSDDNDNEKDNQRLYDNANVNADAEGASVLGQAERFALTTKKTLVFPRSVASATLLGEAPLFQ